MIRYLHSLLARDHIRVVLGVLAWMGSAIWQLWTFGNRPEIWLAVIFMGLGAGAIGYYLAIVNRVDRDKKDEGSDRG